MIWLHIGTHKTGTTALQAFSFLNREALDARGVRYLRAGLLDVDGPGKQSHHALVWTFRKPDMAIPRSVWRDAMQEIAAVADREFVISSEAFCFLDPEVLREVIPADMLDRFRIVVYLRRQDLFLESQYKEVAKLGRFTGNFWEFFRKQGGNGDYLRLVNAWSRVFGRERVIPRIYDRSVLAGGDISADFYSLLGVDVGEGFAHAGAERNPTPRAELVDLLREFALAETGYDSVDMFWKVLKCGARDLKITNDLLSPDERRGVLRSYDYGNDLVRRKFFRDRPRLFDEDDLDRLPPKAPTLDPAVREALRFMFRALAEQRADLRDAA